MMFFRRKDLADVEAVLRSAAGDIDMRVVRATLVGLVGEDDERVAEWDTIVGEVVS